MRTIPLNGKQILVVGVPKDAENFDLGIGNNAYQLEFELLDDNCDAYDWDFLELPEGQYKLLGRKEDVSEEVAKGLVENNWVDGVGSCYVDYENEHDYTDTALESFHSWCRVNNIDKEVLLLKLQ